MVGLMGGTRRTRSIRGRFRRMTWATNKGSLMHVQLCMGNPSQISFLLTGEERLPRSLVPTRGLVRPCFFLN